MKVLIQLVDATSRHRLIKHRSKKTFYICFRQQIEVASVPFAVNCNLVVYR
jgi:hypothetical protein